MSISSGFFDTAGLGTAWEDSFSQRTDPPFPASNSRPESAETAGASSFRGLSLKAADGSGAFYLEGSSKAVSRFLAAFRSAMMLLK